MRTRKPNVIWAGIFVVSLCKAQTQAAGSLFQRGDSNVDGRVNVSDSLNLLGYLFLGQPASLGCEDAADSDDNGFLQLTDAVHTLGFLFLGTPPPPAPFNTCGLDPTDDALSCLSYSSCAQGPPSPPVLSSLAPATRLDSIEVGGTAGAGELVRILGGSAVGEARAGADGKFAINVSLQRNRLNRLFATAEDFSGQTSAPSAAAVTQDSTPPFVSIDEPLDGSQVSSDEVAVTGRVADALSGFQGLSVTVNGQPANVAIGIGTNGTYERAHVPLVLGDNNIQVTATDGAGNMVAPPITARVKRIAPPAGSSRLEIARGGAQTAPIHLELPAPIVVRALRPDGAALEGVAITFHVTRSNGLLAAAPGVARDSSVRTLLVRTDPDGEAAAYWRLGSDAGCGNNRVTATGEGLFGSVLFCASATPGPATQINIGSGNNQRLEAGAPAPEPFRAWVSDSCNGVQGVSVHFRVTRGTGKVNGLEEVTVATGPTGHAEVQFLAGPEPGNHWVEAGMEPQVELPVQYPPALFTAYALTREAGRPATFSGLVLDNAQQPIEGAMCILEIPGHEGMTTRSDRVGQFHFDDLPAAGPASLLVDGYFATHLGGDPGEDLVQGSHPSLSYEVTLVPGAANGLASAVLLPPLDPENQVPYDGTKDVELRVKGIDGLRMLVKAGTVVKLRDGTQAMPGSPVTLSLNQVHHDDVPMPMPDGAAPPFAWTLQPGGARFEPPLSIEYPNMTGLPPGAIAYFLSYDHDTQKFEIVSSGHVKEDGSTIQSDPGQGILVAGWGCNCPPYSVTGECNDCAETDYSKLMQNGAKLVKDVLLAVSKVRDAIKCISAIVDTARNCLNVYETVKVDGDLTCQEVTIALDCVSKIKSSITTCFDVIPGLSGFLETAKQVSKAVGAATDFAIDLGCLPTWAQIALNSVRSINDLAGSMIELTGNLTLKQALLVAACGELDQIVNTLKAACPGGEGIGAATLEPASPGGGGIDVDIAELDRLFASFDVKFQSSFDFDPAIESALQSLDSLLPALDSDIEKVLGDLEQPELSGFVLKVAGQTTIADMNGSYRLSNIAAPDLFGPGGPGTNADFKGDDPVLVTGQATIEGKTYYAFSEFFQLTQSEPFTVEDLTITDVPRPFARSIAFTGAPDSLNIDEAVQLTVTGMLGDGSTQDLSRKADWTIYRTSNAAIVTVGPDGLVTGKTRGTAFITASNVGVTAVKRFDVDLTTLRLILTGVVRLPQGTAAAGASIRSVGGALAFAGADGTFTIEAEALRGSNVPVTLSLEVGGKRYFATLHVTADPDHLGVDLGIITLSEAVPDLFPGRTYPVEDGPRGFAEADLDGDDDLDLAVANSSSSTVSLLFNEGDGTFAEQVTQPVGSGPQSVTAGDFDGDMDIDLTVANAGSESVSLLLNHGDGTFATQVTYPAGVAPVSVIAARLDGDGDLDLAVTIAGASSVGVLLNKGDGTFAALVPYFVGLTPASVTAANLDGDGDIDLAVVSSGSGILSVLINRGDGTFEPHEIYAAGQSPSSVTAARLDGDDDIDLAVSSFGSSAISVFLNNGGGTFAPLVNYPVGLRPQSVAASDLDGDSDADLAAANSDSNSISVILNQGNGTFAAQEVYGTGLSPYSLIAADFDRDGRADLAVSNSGADSVSLLRNQGGAAFAGQGTYAVGQFPSSVTAGKLDGDADLDLAVANFGGNTVSVLLNEGNGAFAAQTTYPAGFLPNALATADLDLDGDLDLAVANGLGSVSVLLNQGGGTFAAQVAYSVGALPRSIAAARLDGDGDVDLAVANFGSNNVSVLLNQGNGTFAPQVTYAVGLQPQSVAAAPLDGDVDVDLVVANTGSGTVSVLLNQGAGTFAPQVTYEVGLDPFSVAAANLNGDGGVDLAVANQRSNTISVLLNQGNGTFAAQVPYGAGSKPSAVIAADLDGDGEADLAAADSGQATVSVFRNLGNGVFAAKAMYSVGSEPSSVTAADLDGDGNLDLGVASHASRTVSVLLNQSQP